MQPRPANTVCLLLALYSAAITAAAETEGAKWAFGKLYTREFFAKFGQVGASKLFEGGGNIAVHCKANRTFALTFDDGPCKHTWELLDILRANKLPATFYLVGKQALGHRRTVRRMLREGHMVAAHGLTHRHLNVRIADKTYRDYEATGRVERWSDNVDQAGWEMFAGTQSLYQVTGEHVRHYRPAFFEFDPYGLVYVSGNQVDLATCDTHDWYWNMRANNETFVEALGDATAQQYVTGKMVQMVTSGLEQAVAQGGLGLIHLQHDVHLRSVRSTQAVIDAVRAAGYRFVRMDECTGVPQFWPRGRR